MKVLSVDVGCGHYAVCCATLPDVDVACLDCWRLGDTKSMPASRIVDRLLERFRDWSFLERWSPDVVLIEQQMRGAHINLALAFATYTYFRTRWPDRVVRFVKPSLKLQAFANFVQGVEVQAVPSDYARRKRYAVKLAQDILKAKGLPSLEMLCPSAASKKDDLADAFLQCFCA